MQDCTFKPTKISKFDFSFEEKDTGKRLYEDSKLRLKKKMELTTQSKKLKVKKTLKQLERIQNLYVTKD